MAFKKILHKYPYHSLLKAATQNLVDFPIQFGSKTNIDPEDYSFEENETAGFIQGYKVFMEAFVAQDFKSLEDIAEWTMVYRLKSVWDKYEKLGYSMKLVGSPDSIKCFYIAKDLYIGSLCPLRNLNYPSEYYDIDSKRVSERLDDGLKAEIIQLKDFEYKMYEVEELESLDLHKINREFDKSEYADQVLCLIRLLSNFPLIVLNVDVGFVTDYKIVVLDSAGCVVGGSDDKSLEFHTFRFEKTIPNSIHWISITKKSRKIKEFLKKLLENYLHQYIIIDIDGFMDKNLIIPRKPE